MRGFSHGTTVGGHPVFRFASYGLQLPRYCLVGDWGHGATVGRERLSTIFYQYFLHTEAAMVFYRRNRVEGGTYFFTVTLADRRSQVLTDHVNELRHVFRQVRTRQPFEVVAIVVMPEHLHAIWTLPEGDADYSGRWKAIKAGLTHQLRLHGMDLASNAKGEYSLWQRRFWEHTLCDEIDLQRHVDYIHYNPVKHGLVGHVKDWPWSSFHRYVRQGILPVDWGSSPQETVQAGEIQAP